MDLSNNDKLTDEKTWVGDPVKVILYKVQSVDLDKTSVKMSKGDSIQISATIKSNDDNIKQVKWTSSNEAVATVNENGLVIAKADGTATITAPTTYNGIVSANSSAYIEK